MKRNEHPAFALMCHAASGYLVKFQTDLTVHDAAALAGRQPHEAFAWVLHPGATWLAFMGPQHRPHRFAGMFVSAYGAEETRCYFWDGTVFTLYRSAAALDERIADYEQGLRERASGECRHA